MQKRIKNKKCKNEGCGKEFKPFNSLQRACSPVCESEIIIRKAKEKEERREKNQGNQLKVYLESTKTICHAYIRLRDRGKNCISCNKPWSKDFQAGHLFSGGGHSNVKFNEENINGQCPSCNSSSVFDVEKYIVEFEKRYSPEEFEVLRAQAYEEKRWTVEELKSLGIYYRNKIKELTEKQA